MAEVVSQSKNHRFLEKPLEWRFPARNCHDGIPLSNGLLGALIWGESDLVRITLNRADYWDHRGGLEWKPEANYRNLRRWLEARDEDSIRRAFEGEPIPGEPPRPTRLPMGRVNLTLPECFAVAGGALNLARGEAELEAKARSGSGRIRLRAVILMEEPVLAIKITWPCGFEPPEIGVIGVPAHEGAVRDYFEKYGIQAPERFEEDGIAGWAQVLPEDPTMCVAWREVEARDGREIYITSVYGDTPEEAIFNARNTLERKGYEDVIEGTVSWWQGFWGRTAVVDTPDPATQLLYYLGVYKLGCISVPGRPAATLQGPWVEEYRLPPWSGDYHFNINVQECYWPAYASNHLEALEPLFDLIRSWEPRLRKYARVFAGIDDGYQLPHAVDDRCTCMGGFWTGAIDHGSTAWTGHLMWLYWKYSGDEEFLRETAYPFLKGTMRVYEAMLEDDEEGLCLPVSVSPEFGGNSFDAWGKNASFQLAIVHFLCRALIEASELLGVDEEQRRRWNEIDRRLPVASTSGPEPHGEILLWEGKPLGESHRHHSHLAGIYPFDVLDYRPGGRHYHLVRNSMRNLALWGMGAWTGWCIPWASILYARQGNGGMAELLLQIFRRCFMRPGYASTHDAVFPGLTVMDSRKDIMQVEAALGAAEAVMEMLLHTSAGITYVFPALPEHWKAVSFDDLRCEGGCFVSGKYENGRTTYVGLRSEAGGRLVLANPYVGRPAFLCYSDGRTERLPEEEALIEVELPAGCSVEIVEEVG